MFDHGSDKDDDPNRFRVIVTFDEQGDKKTDARQARAAPSLADVSESPDTSER